MLPAYIADMRTVSPEVHLLGKPQIHWPGVKRYLEHVGGMKWFERVYPLVCNEDRLTGESVTGPLDVHLDDGEALVEFMGRLCYKSWDVGLNPNVTKVREDSAEYLANVLSQLHGSVFEHANYNFAFENVSRVETHEHVRHRVGVAISQESMRYVRLDDLPIWQPDWALEDEALQIHVRDWIHHTERLQEFMAKHFKLDNPGVPFSEKKAKTSYMRRWSPQGVATQLGWSANIRTIRWVLQQRTEGGAEEEIRMVMQQMGFIMKEVCPNFFADFTEDEQGQWVTNYRKV